MNWCKLHWDMLRAAIDVRGLSKFGAQNAHELHDDFDKQLNGEDTKFDPLLGSWMRINQQMLKDAGLRAIEGCSLCVLVEDKRPELVQNWIDGVTDNALAYAVEMGLVTK